MIPKGNSVAKESFFIASYIIDFLSTVEQENLLTDISNILSSLQNVNEDDTTISTLTEETDVASENIEQSAEQPIEQSTEQLVGQPKVKTPYGSSEGTTKHCEEIVSDMKSAGFTNIEIKVLYELGTGWIGRSVRLNMYDMTIDGKDVYEKNDEFVNDSKVLITYRDFEIMNPDIQFETYKVSAIFSDVDKNALNAEEKYKGKNIEIEGYVGDIDTNGNFYLYSTNSQWEIIGIKCHVLDISEHKDVVRTLNKGDRIKVKGNLYLLNQYGGDLSVYRFD